MTHLVRRALGIGRGERQDNWLVVVIRQLVQNFFRELENFGGGSPNHCGRFDQVDGLGQIRALVVLVSVRDLPVFQI